jgi:tyrosyl-tRNA synthetase
MTTDEKIALITRNLEETLTQEELRALIESGTPLRHYIGFEISGKLHIGHFFQLLKVKDLQDAGAETIIWLADIHSAINDKLGGDLEIIKKVGKDYFIPAMKVLFECIGGDPEKLIFKFTSEEYAKNPDFWLTFLEMGKSTTLARNLRSITIMGREQTDDIDSAKIMYPILQAADIFLLQVNIAQAGIDQRKVHVVAREAANHIKTFALKNKGEQIKPIAIHAPILLGLDLKDFVPDGDADVMAMKTKMSKSKAGSAVSVHDSPDDIKDKLNSAFAPEGIIVGNPVLNWTRYLMFYDDGASLTVRYPEKFGGGSKTYQSYEDLEKDYAEKKLHPQDLKAAVADWLIAKLAPARGYFEDPARKQALEEITRLTLS